MTIRDGPAMVLRQRVVVCVCVFCCQRTIETEESSSHLYARQNYYIDGDSNDEIGLKHIQIVMIAVGE